MKRGGQANREREALKQILAELPFLCLDCGTAAGRVEWDADHDRYRLIVHHDRACVVLKHPWFRRCADEYLRGQLLVRGYATGDYLDSPAAHR